MTKFQNVKEGQTLNILFQDFQTTAIIFHKSVNQIAVRFWNPNGLEEVIRYFTTNGKLRYIKNENSKIISESL